ncbi:hypothetical protein HQ47_06135 [Porphyromonas macacae]|uniref:Uncharacterized protein n=1 Tax=Porphyromonas macacae TaxID=28115 RepID=A0A0A2E5B0_9PORP|nr:hypothetical protein HQ47_06135 [Porphyromonas macacae]SUB88641.1 Uncharacterised protein [Porphyromonas macacae]
MSRLVRLAIYNLMAKGAKKSLHTPYLIYTQKKRHPSVRRTKRNIMPQTNFPADNKVKKELKQNKKPDLQKP